MKILHVIDNISKNSGGPARSVQGLVVEQNRSGIEAWLMALQYGDEPWVEGDMHFINGGVFENELQRIKPQIVHLHGIWSLALHRCSVICRRVKIPYVIAPRGMLEPWSLQQKWLKKSIARWLYQDKDIKKAAALHATAESEAQHFRKLGFDNLVIISPNGVNVPNKYNPVKHGKQIEQKILFVSRMHPKKGVLELVDAFSTCYTNSEQKNNWTIELVYTVNGEFEREYEKKVRERVTELGLENRFIFTGALSDDKKWVAYARADLFVLPTYSENFGIVVAEALWAGVPVITTKGTPWQELEEYKCGWWIDIGVDSLTSALKEAMSLDDIKRQEMGKRGRVLVEKKYTWDAVVKALVNGYEEILHDRT